MLNIVVIYLSETLQHNQDCASLIFLAHHVVQSTFSKVEIMLKLASAKLATFKICWWGHTINYSTVT